MALKVIGGEFRGRNLQSIRGMATRPLLGRVREAIFDVLADRVQGQEVWDLFAGTGANGIEALSRGARRVIFLEKSNQALKTLRANLDIFEPEVRSRCHVMRANAWKPGLICPEGEATEVPPGIIFLDPPYKEVIEDPSRIAAEVRALHGRLAPDGLLCFHFQDGHLDRDDFDLDVEMEIRRWGRSAVAFLEAGDAEPRIEDQAD